MRHRSHVVEHLSRVWSRLQETVLPQGTQAQRQRRRRIHRRQLSQAWEYLWPRLGVGSQSRLARHHATAIVCADMSEVRAWHDYLGRLVKRSTQQQPPRPEKVAAVVHWVPLPQGGRAAVLVIDGPASTVEYRYLLAHELAHIVLKEDDRPIHDEPQWKAIWRQEREHLAERFLDTQIKADVKRDAKEALAWALALHWLSQDFARTHPRMSRFVSRLDRDR
ncbi:M78 family metallopeptidase domain-containing protein [Thermopirellula anaerolimosa]